MSSPERCSVTIVVSDTEEAALARLCHDLMQANIEVRIVSDRPHAFSLPGCESFVTGPGECLWEIIPPCDLVVCTDRAQEDEVRSHTGFPYITVTRMHSAFEETLRALEDVGTGSKRFRSPMVSVCMIAKDEEQNLGRALRSVFGVAGEIILVDTGSSDRTPQIAKQHGARVFTFPWNDDFSAARNESLAHAKGDWILVLDADEVLSPEFRRTILKQLQIAYDVEAYATSLVDIVNGKPSQRCVVVRLFRNRPMYRYEGRVHEQVAPSILRAKGNISKINIQIFHYGYTAAESVRKGRRQRNRLLLERGYREQPERVDYWYHLGQEALAVHDLKTAEFWLRKVLLNAPTHPLSALSAPLLAACLEQLGDIQDAWAVAQAGVSTSRGKSKSLAVLGHLALHDGDFVVAGRCADELQHLPPDAEGMALADQLAAQLRAECLFERGRRQEALLVGEKLLRVDPADVGIAFWYVHMLERARGIRAASVDVIRRFKTVGAKAAAIQPLVHGAEWGLASQLAHGTRSLVQSRFHVVALLRSRDERAATEVARSLGVEGAIILALWGLECNDSNLMVEALSGDVPSSHCQVMCHIQKKMQVPASLEWALRFWMEIAGDLHMDRAFRQLTSCLPGDEVSQVARAALIVYENGRKREGLELALRAPSEPEALQVLGLTAYEHHDWEAAATFLQARAAFGNAPVRVYWRGLLALRQLGKVREAEVLLNEGRKARPLSELLAHPPLGN